ncbi:MAG: BMC domain-containing protein [Lachnospiraceae bacterium]|nr:BMC domain-containing protein [Lachnospiraceae bacterium]
MKQALGMLEVRGLCAAITVGDAMAKAAQVHIRQKTKAKGNGWITILVTGEVSAVQAAVQAGSTIAREYEWFVSEKVIPRPAYGIEDILDPDIADLQKQEEKEAEVKAEEVKKVEALKKAEPEKKPEEPKKQEAVKPAESAGAEVKKETKAEAPKTKTVKKKAAPKQQEKKGDNKK